MQIPPLAANFVHLEPLEAHHVPELWAVANEPGLWTYMGWDVATLADLAAWVAARQSGTHGLAAEPFAVRCVADGRLAGSTSLFDIDPQHHTMEVGHTWLGAPYRRTVVNTATKRAILEHAFVAHAARRVQLKCDARNYPSRRAIERIGGRFEGVLRKHRRLPDGTWRDTAMHSVTDDEWPGVRDRLDRILDAAEA